MSLETCNFQFFLMIIACPVNLTATKHIIQQFKYVLKDGNTCIHSLDFLVIIFIKYFRIRN